MAAFAVLKPALTLSFGHSILSRLYRVNRLVKIPYKEAGYFGKVSFRCNVIKIIIALVQCPSPLILSNIHHICCYFRSFISATFGDDFLGPIKKVPVPKNSTATVIVDTETNESGDDKDKDKKKSKKDIAQEEKENLAPKNAQNAHEAIRPAENEGKVSLRFECS